jgi:hypothetical protein
MVCVSVPDLWLRSSLLLVEYHEAIRMAIPRIVECLVDSQWYVRSQAISALSKLGAHGLCERPRPVVALIPFGS